LKKTKAYFCVPPHQVRRCNVIRSLREWGGKH